MDELTRLNADGQSNVIDIRQAKQRRAYVPKQKKETKLISELDIVEIFEAAKKRAALLPKSKNSEVDLKERAETLFEVASKIMFLVNSRY